MIHYDANKIQVIAAARLKQLSEHYSTKELPVTFDSPLIHAGSLLMVSTMYYKGVMGSIQVPIQAGMFDPQVFEHAITDRVEHVFGLIDAEPAA